MKTPPRCSRRFAIHALFGAVVVAAPVSGAAQDTIAAKPPGGWIGISTDTARLFIAGREEPTLAIRVAAIHVSGPAELGGVLPGDILLAWDDRALDSYAAWLSSVADLDFGQQVMLRLLRGGVEHEVTIVAGDRPKEGYQGRLDLTGVDSIAISDRVIRNLRASRQAILQITAGGSFVGSVLDSTSLTITMDDSSATLDLQRIEVFSDARELRELNEISVSGAARAAPPPTAPAVAEELAVGLVAAPDSAVPDSAVPDSVVAEILDDAVLSFDNLSVRTPFAPTSSVVLGGAQVRTLSGDWGRLYFGVERGLLILDVITLSPARRAGFRPGDVIIAVGGRGLGTLPQLMAALNQAQLPVQVTVIRRGERIELTFPVR